MVQISPLTAAVVAFVGLAAAPALAAPITTGSEQFETRAVRRPSGATVKRVVHGASRALDHAGNLLGIVTAVQGLVQREESEGVEARSRPRPSFKPTGLGGWKPFNHDSNTIGVVGALPRDIEMSEDLDARVWAGRGAGRATVRRPAWSHNGPLNNRDLSGEDLDAPGRATVRRPAWSHNGPLNNRDLSDDSRLEARGGIPLGIGGAVKHVVKQTIINGVRHAPRDIEDIDARDIDDELEMRDFEDLEDLFEREYEVDEMD
ncbi:hypothetical protein DFP72DRAFT_882590 [Ephemerocybe angulata]|uniref:Uncharacterized protein n=1 Tax=Ephemerocybe angulata TaxID=980116 RepID=A0A8H6IB17_9AGAR|nr:hypothetical protein DFP72DRAFT_882590 [Tulosesus angulatus]